jgi:hypothetical protein
MPKALSVGISTLPDALDRFEAAWHLATGRGTPPALERLAFADLPLLLKTLSPARWQLLTRPPEGADRCRCARSRSTSGATTRTSIPTLPQLLQLGLIERAGKSLVHVRGTRLRAELRL